MQNPNKTTNSKAHFLPMGIFLVFVLSITLVFFICVFRDIEKNAQETVASNIEHQSQNFQNIIDQHFQYVEAVAQYMGQQDELTDAQNLSLLTAMAEKSSMSRMLIIDSDGTGYYPSGDQQHVGDYPFFQKAMGGERALGGPFESNIDGELCMVLASPIYHGDSIVGVLGASCKLATLADMLLADSYSDSGCVLIANADGDVLSYKADERMTDLISYKSNFFNQLYNVRLPKSKTRNMIIEDFAEQNSELFSFSYRKKPYYMGYKSLGLEDWMLCYMVPRSVARSSYQFITRYGIILCVTLILGMAALLLTILLSTNRTQTELLEMGQSDLLTGMLNKKSTEEMIQQWLDCEQRIGLQAFVMIDIDHFKEVNDTYGHAVGDEILREVSKIIRQEFREGDVIGRLGGDEFCILLKNIVSDTNAIAKVKMLHESIRNHKFKAMGEDGRVTCSIGVSYAPMYGNSFDELYHTADLALYKTKKGGRDGFNIYDGKDE